MPTHAASQSASHSPTTLFTFISGHCHCHCHFSPGLPQPCPGRCRVCVCVYVCRMSKSEAGKQALLLVTVSCQKACAAHALTPGLTRSTLHTLHPTNDDCFPFALTRCARHTTDTRPYSLFLSLFPIHAGAPANSVPTIRNRAARLGHCLIHIHSLARSWSPMRKSESPSIAPGERGDYSNSNDCVQTVRDSISGLVGLVLPVQSLVRQLPPVPRPIHRNVRGSALLNSPGPSPSPPPPHHRRAREKNSAQL
ncbi:hypothetical protein B0J11DRAFT_329725 [Dendryphion nanum]|uniref:Uncharacterized protein n=1 Tax=Dendryphion nanum TaxID=256645 RepID=A0A9P9DS39_9PLEO|nr:hypothetical protein B0J11DRAFT_329725 [Dendryphion nanum]